MDSVRLAASAIVFCGVTLIVRQTQSSFSALLRMAALVLFSFAALSASAPAIEYLDGLFELTGFSAYALVIVKSLGVAALCGGAASLCRDLGEGSVASVIELSGKAEIFILCIPLMSELLDGVRNLIFWE